MEEGWFWGAKKKRRMGTTVDGCVSRRLSWDAGAVVMAMTEEGEWKKRR